MKKTLKSGSLFLLALIVLTGCVNQTKGTEQIKSGKKSPKNIILLIGDGMGLAQIQAGLTANHGELNLERSQYVGLSTTHSADNYVTDSGASGTALATGTKTNNGAIGVDVDGNPVKNIVEILSDQNYQTGVISTSTITHATPAAFVAHEKSRNDYENIAADFLESPVDLFIGGGQNHFKNRTDGRDITQELEEKGFSIYENYDQIEGNEEKIGMLTAPEHNIRVLDGRTDMLPQSFDIAIKYFTTNDAPFFLMIESSQIDWGGHDHDIDYITSELIDFDNVVGKALDFAEKDGETLVIITSDHETGGLSVNNGNYETGEVEAKFTTGSHTGIMVPVFTYGPGAERFSGMYDNIDIFTKIRESVQ